MTGRELIVYILENNLENENIFNPGEDLEGCIYILKNKKYEEVKRWEEI